MIEALRLTSYANRLPRTPVLQGHKFIKESDRTVKSASYFADGNKIKRTLRGIKGQNGEVRKGEDERNQNL